MSNLSLVANYSNYIDSSISKNSFQSLLDNDPKSLFINAFNAIPYNIEYLLSNVNLLIQFINSYPGTTEEISSFIYNEISDYLHKTEKNNESYYNKIEISENIKEAFTNSFNISYRNDIPLIILLLPFIKNEIFISLSNKFKNSYNSPIDNFKTIVAANHNIDNIFFERGLDYLKESNFKMAQLFFEIDESSYNSNSNYQNLDETLVKSLPFYQSFQENYKKISGQEYYHIFNYSSLLTILAHEHIEFLNLYFNKCSHSSQYSLQTLINLKFDHIELHNTEKEKEKEALPYFLKAIEAIEQNIKNTYSYDENIIADEIKKNHLNIILNAYNISPNFPNKIFPKLQLNQTFKNFLKSPDFNNAINVSTISSTTTFNNFLRANPHYLFEIIPNYNGAFDLSDNFLYNLLVHENAIIDKNNNTVAETQDYSKYLNKKKFSLNLINELNLNLSETIRLALSKPILQASQEYEDNIQLIVSSYKSSQLNEFVFELLINVHPELNDFLNNQSDDFTLKSVHQLMKKYFFRELLPSEKESSHYKKIKDTFPDGNINSASLNLMSQNNIHNYEKEPFLILCKYFETLNLMLKNNSSSAKEIVLDIKPHISIFIESLFESPTYSKYLYPTYIKNISLETDFITNVVDIVFNSNLWTNTEITSIVTQIDKSYLSNLYYENEKTYEKLFQDLYIKTDSEKLSFKNSIKQFEQPFLLIESKVMQLDVTDNNNYQQASIAKKIKKF